MFVWKSTFETMRKAWQHSQGEILDRDIKIRELTKALDEIKFHNFAIAQLRGEFAAIRNQDPNQGPEPMTEPTKPTCQTCKHWIRAADGWRGYCNIDLPPQLRDVALDDFARADDTCSLHQPSEPTP